MTIAVYRGPDRGYSLTDNDVLWLARGFAAEGPHTKESARWLFWTWMNRFLLMPGASWADGTFAKLVEYHAQSLSPLWLDPSGEKCTKFPEYCTAWHIQRRATNRSRTKAQLGSAGVWQFAMDAQAGKLPRPSGPLRYDFEACTQAKAGTKNIGGNCFYAFDDLPTWQKNLVAYGDRVEVWPSSAGIAKVAGIAAAGICVGYFAWIAWDRRRR